MVSGFPAVFPLPVGEFLCPWCRKNKVGEPHSMAQLSGGALWQSGKDSSASANDLAGFLEIGWHGAHSEEGGEGRDANVCLSLELATKVAGGQFEFYFCSTKCLRAFLNFCVDELELAVAQRRARKRG